MKNKIVYIALIIISLFQVETKAQIVDWTKLPYPNGATFILPATISLSLPTTNNFEIGLFIQRNDSLLNIGKVNYVPNVQTTIPIVIKQNTFFDLEDQIITLVRDKSTLMNYGIEFTYQDDNNTVNQNETNIVNGIFSDTWRKYTEAAYCRYVKYLVIPIPYGIRPKISYSADCVVDSSGKYPVILFSEMPKTSIGGTFQITSANITFTNPLNSFGFLDFPFERLDTIFEVCPQISVTVQQFTAKDNLSRTAIGNTPYQLVNPGKYYYTTVYTPNSCTTIDTISLVNKFYPLNRIDTTYLICRGDIIHVPVSFENDSLKRTASGNTPFTISTPGKYIYSTTYVPNGCALNDTVTLIEKKFPSSGLDSTYTICQGNVVTIPTFTVKDSLSRTAIGNTPYQLISPGKYYYKVSYHSNQCFTTDTVTIKYTTNCTGNRESNLINPLKGDHVVFTESERITIYNSHKEKVSEFDSPVIWTGTNQYGSVLPVGYYFIIHSNGHQETITIAY